jgi:NitT/TauT family transport system substrate-binding protein
MAPTQTRRQVLAGLAAAAGSGILPPRLASAAEERLETTTLRLLHKPSICGAPQYVAEELLRAEGFTDIRYTKLASSAEVNEAIIQGRGDLDAHFAPQWVSALDSGGAMKILAGVHVGCFVLFGNERVRTISDLKGKSVGVSGIGGSDHLFLAVMAGHIGLDPKQDINWVTSLSPRPDELFAEGKIDACLGLPPVAQDLRARKIGQVVVNSSIDQPWTQYFCCMLGANREFVRDHPVAAKRAVRAVLKATDLCARQPAQAAQRLINGGFTPRYDYALDALTEIPYDRWRDYDAEDTVRFYALRLRDLGFIKSSPQKIIAEGTDWRFFNELKRELKG